MLLTEEEKTARLSRAYSGGLNIPKSMNRATMALFWEHRYACRWKERGITPVYNLGYTDHDGTLSMPQIYLQCVSEREAALVLLGSWAHWKRLMATDWFMKHLTKWREDKLEQDGELGIEVIREQASKGNVQAAKYLDQLRRNKKEPPQPQAKAKAPKAVPQDSKLVDEFIARSRAHIKDM